MRPVKRFLWALGVTTWVVFALVLLRPSKVTMTSTKVALIRCHLQDQAFADAGCTPGSVFEVATLKEICVPGYATRHRHVSDSDKRRIERSYGVMAHVPYGKPGSHEDDHLIPLELGGDNTDKNLWPEPWPGNTVKDVAENVAHRAVCAKEMSLPLARAEMRRYAR